MDPILYWNDVALQANLVSHTNGKSEQTGPTLSSRALAIVHLAMHDAFARTEPSPDLPPYLTTLPAPAAAASRDAAVAGASYTTLVALFPSQAAAFALSVTPWKPAPGEVGPVKDGFDFGVLVGEAILDARKNDPGAGDAGYTSSTHARGHRPDPDSPGQGYHGPFYGTHSSCFAVTARHDLKPPPAASSQSYVKAVREVRAKGIAPEQLATVPGGTRRTPEETVIGVFWAYDGASGLGTPPRLYNQIIRKVADRQGNSPARNARLFALVNVAMADAGILAWTEKFKHDLWRPVLALREHDQSMGPDGAGQSTFDRDCDPSWLPLGAPNSNVVGGKNSTPPFPAYPSGHATFAAAAFQITRLFYDGDAALAHQPDALFRGLTMVSDEMNGVTTDNRGTVRPKHVRTFDDGLWEMIEENGRSRVYLGVHFVFDAFAVKGNGKPDLLQDVGGVPLGLKIAEDIFAAKMARSTVGPAA